MPNRRKGFVLGGATLAGLACLAAALEERLPPGVSAVLYELAVPPAAAPTPDRVALGDKLFNDKRLSVNDRVSCATCHDPARGFVDHKTEPDGVAAPAQRRQRNSLAVLNAMFNATQFSDGPAPPLQAEARLLMLKPNRMGQKSRDG